MYFCTKCLKDHNKFPSLKSHQVNDVQSSEPTNADDSVESEEDIALPFETLRCTIHQGEVIGTYCKDHDEVCCGVCAVVKHRPCTTESIAVVAKDFKHNPEVNGSKEELANLLVLLKQEKEKKRTENLDHTDKAKLEMIQNVDSYEEQIIAKVKTLADLSRKDILSKFQEHKKALDYDVGALDAVIKNTELYFNKLEKLLTDDELLFGNVKMSKTVRKDVRALLEVMATDWRKKEFKYNFHKTLENLVEGMESFGKLEEYFQGENVLAVQKCGALSQPLYQSRKVSFMPWGAGRGGAKRGGAKRGGAGLGGNGRGGKGRGGKGRCGKGRDGAGRYGPYSRW